MKKFLACIILVLLAAGFFGANLGSLSYLKGDENYYFQVGRRMIKDNDFVTPRYHHHIRFEKPPLYYWLTAGSFKLLGVSWRAARASSVIFGVLTLLLVYLLAYEFFGRGAAFFSVLALGTNELFFRYARLCVSDITFLFLITLALFLFIKSYKAKSNIFFIASFVPMGLAALTKGPVGPVLIILTIIVFAVKYRGSASVFRVGNIFLGSILFLGVVSPWIMAMIEAHKDVFLQHVWGVEILSKASLKPFVGENIIDTAWYYVSKFGYYVPVVVFSFLPWSIFLPFALFRKKNPSRHEGYSFILSWFWVVFIFFSVAGFKHTHYMLALSPALAMIIGIFFDDISQKRKGLKAVPVTIGIVAIAFFLSFTIAILPNLDDGAMRVFSLKIANNIEKDNYLGMASRQFNIKKMGIHLNNLISDPHEASGDDLAQYIRIDKRANLNSLLDGERKIFVLITESDYAKYVSHEVKTKVHVLEMHKVWKKQKPNKELLQTILDKNFDELKEEAYLITNRR